ncbi:hypothetical protein J2853_000186 [Streptosporangium lutulentum]|uniref:Uncharacterized protein n=1 Tax=Streptosporangium lutulentum TaxID=1461250 RepID=A0ABT9Q2K9_9ACTN|nr:hypothetical protein [Streptosporangium lutulentum]
MVTSLLTKLERVSMAKCVSPLVAKKKSPALRS